MYKNFKKNIPFLFMISFTFSFLGFHDETEAAAKCVVPAKTYVKTIDVSAREYEASTIYEAKYSTPTTPVLKEHVHDRTLKTSDFSSKYTYSYTKKIYSQPRKQKVYQTYYCPASTGSSAKGDLEYAAAYDSGSAKYLRDKDYSEVKDATIKITKTSGTASQGYSEATVEASNPSGGKSSGTARSYYVNKMDVSVSDSKTYEDEPYASVTCTKYYGFGVGDNHTEDCKNDVTVTDDNKTSIRTICYVYTENTNSNKDCMERVYTEKVELKGPSDVYTGQHHIFTCEATFHDGTTKNVHTIDKTLSSTPRNFIGGDWFETGYKKPDNTYVKPSKINAFYSTDNYKDTYTIQCVYYPDTLTSYSGHKNVTDTVKQKKDTMEVKHHGIEKIVIDSSGYFSNGTGEYKFVSNVDKSSERHGSFTNAKFITGHWYDFTATLYHTDGVKRDITNYPEVYWTSNPWFDGQTPYNKANSYDTNMTKSGLGHRIPNSGENTIAVEYFNRNVPQNQSNAANDSLPSRNTMSLETRQIKKLEIRDESGYNTPAKTQVNAGDMVNYSAWAIWTDNTKEDWTNAVQWSGEYQAKDNIFEFNFRSNNNKTTVTAFYADGDRVGEASINNWDSNYAKIEVNIKYNCAEAEELTWGCDLPKGKWQTEPQKYFESTNTNFLPPPEAFGLDGESWKEDGVFRQEYPYNFAFKFNVSGVSEGN